MVLGLLHAAPMHGYDIHKRLDTIHAEAWADVLPGSIYHALKQMEKEGLLAVEATARSGNRLRAVYALTDAGRRAYLAELRRAWAVPPRAFPTGLYAAIAFLDDLPRSDATALIDALVPALEREIAYWAEGEGPKDRRGRCPRTHAPCSPTGASGWRRTCACCSSSGRRSRPPRRRSQAGRAMALRPDPVGPVPAETACAARVLLLHKGHRLLRRRDELGTIYHERRSSLSSSCRSPVTPP